MYPIIGLMSGVEHDRHDQTTTWQRGGSRPHQQWPEAARSMPLGDQLGAPVLAEIRAALVDGRDRGLQDIDGNNIQPCPAKLRRERRCAMFPAPTTATIPAVSTSPVKRGTAREVEGRGGRRSTEQHDRDHRAASRPYYDSCRR